LTPVQAAQVIRFVQDWEPKAPALAAIYDQPKITDQAPA
jgi:hypothetical protein